MRLMSVRAVVILEEGGGGKGRAPRLSVRSVNTFNLVVKAGGSNQMERRTRGPCSFSSSPPSGSRRDARASALSSSSSTVMARRGAGWASHHRVRRVRSSGRRGSGEGGKAYVASVVGGSGERVVVDVVEGNVRARPVRLGVRVTSTVNPGRCGGSSLQKISCQCPLVSLYHIIRIYVRIMDDNTGNRSGSAGRESRTGNSRSRVHNLRLKFLNRKQ